MLGERPDDQGVNADSDDRTQGFPDFLHAHSSSFRIVGVDPPSFLQPSAGINNVDDPAVAPSSIN
jgi:hypothetical protein